MIHLKRSVTDLAVGHEQICDFNHQLEQIWIPGFYTSYKRRQAAYTKALTRYEERNKFVRVVFKAPKPPGKPSPNLGEEIEKRLWQDWLAALSISSAKQLAENHTGEDADSENNRLVQILSQRVDDSYFVINDLETNFTNNRVTVVVGPSGGWMATATPDSRTQFETQLEFTPLPSLQIDDVPFPHVEEEEALNPVYFDQLALFQIIDDLLLYHQSLCSNVTISAPQEAERLMKREKDYLLRLAATL